MIAASDIRSDHVMCFSRKEVRPLNSFSIISGGGDGAEDDDEADVTADNVGNCEKLPNVGGLLMMLLAFVSGAKETGADDAICQPGAAGAATAPVLLLSKLLLVSLLLLLFSGWQFASSPLCFNSSIRCFSFSASFAFFSFSASIAATALSYCCFCLAKNSGFHFPIKFLSLRAKIRRRR